MYLRFVKNNFQAVKNKFGNSCHGFFQTRKLTIYKMVSGKKSYKFQSLLKNITLLPAEKFGNINFYQQTVLLKIIYGFRIEISFMEKQKFLYSKKIPFRYVYSIAIMYSCETVCAMLIEFGKKDCKSKQVSEFMHYIRNGAFSVKTPQGTALRLIISSITIKQQ